MPPERSAWISGSHPTSLGVMCQYQSECPTTRHRPGTKCPVRVGIENHNRKVDEANRGIGWGIAGLIVLAILVGAFVWFYAWEGATGSGIPFFDDLILGTSAATTG